MSDFRTQYDATLTRAGLFDRSDAAKLELNGPDAAMFLGNLCTNDIKKLAVRSGCAAYFCDSRAKVQFQTWIYRTAEEAFWVETTPGRNGDLLKYLDRYLISERVEFVDRTADYAQFLVAGPTAKDTTEDPSGGAFLIHELAELCRSNRSDLLGFPAYDVVVPNADAEKRWKQLVEAGATPASPEVFETMRIEHGTPLFGPDIDTNRFVMEVARAERAVSYSKGCYLGQEPIVMARDRAGHVNRAFLGMKVLEGGLLPPGAKVFHDGVEVGIVTSSCHSARLGQLLSLGYLRWKHQEAGTRMEAETPTGRQPIEVLGNPPVKPPAGRF